MPKIKHSKKSKSKVKTIKIRGEGLIKVLDNIRQKIEDFSHNEMMNGVQIQSLATRDRERYKTLWNEYQTLLKKYINLAESISGGRVGYVDNIFEWSKAITERDMFKTSTQEHKKMREIAEGRAEEFGEKNISYGEEVESLQERIEYLRDQLRTCNPKHEEFEEEDIEEKNFYHSRLNGKRKPRVEH